MSVFSTLLLQQFDHSCVQAIRCVFPSLLCCVLESIFHRVGTPYFYDDEQLLCQGGCHLHHDEKSSQETIVLKLKVSTGCCLDCNSIPLSTFVLAACEAACTKITKSFGQCWRTNQPKCMEV